MLNNNILVIEDNQTLTNLIEKSLKEEGFRVSIATNGQEGLDVYKKKKPALTILDLKMPGMDGVEFLEQINLKPSDHSFVIVLTAHGDDDTIEKCYELGVSAFIEKPFNILNLKGVVKNSLAVKNSQLEMLNKIDKHKKSEEQIPNSVIRNDKHMLNCNLKERTLIINEEVINLPPNQFVIYLHYLTNKKSRCKCQDKISCKDCKECFETINQTSRSKNQIAEFYKEIYSENIYQYKTLKKNLKKGQILSYKDILQKISKINKKIKSILNDDANLYVISNINLYGNTVYGIKLDKNKIFF